MEVDSNHRSNLQQIYSLSPLATRESIHMIFLSKADDRTRTDNLLITNQLLCQLSHIGTIASRSAKSTQYIASNHQLPEQGSNLQQLG